MGSTDAFLVEGRDDLQVIQALWRIYTTSDFPCRIEDLKGIDPLLASVRLRLKALDSDIALQRLGIVVDADPDAGAAADSGAALSAGWRSLRDILQKAGYQNVPAIPLPDGTILRQADRPTVGIWLMPNNTLSGMLEDFLSSLVPAGDVLLPRARACLDAIPPEQCRFAQQYRSKALIHTWLAWQEIPGQPFGTAITARVFDGSALDAVRFVSWIRDLFDVSEA